MSSSFEHKWASVGIAWAIHPDELDLAIQPAALLIESLRALKEDRRSLSLVKVWWVYYQDIIDTEYLNTHLLHCDSAEKAVFAAITGVRPEGMDHELYAELQKVKAAPPKKLKQPDVWKKRLACAGVSSSPRC